MLRACNLVGPDWYLSKLLASSCPSGPKFGNTGAQTDDNDNAPMSLRVSS